MDISIFEALDPGDLPALTLLDVSAPFDTTDQTHDAHSTPGDFVRFKRRRA